MLNTFYLNVMYNDSNSYSFDESGVSTSPEIYNSVDLCLILAKVCNSTDLCFIMAKP